MLQLDFNPFIAGTDIKRQNRRQILAPKFDPRTERVKYL